MEKIISIIYFVVFLTFILGLIKPALVLRWNTEKTRKKVFIYFGIPFLVLTTVVGSIDKEKSTPTHDATQENAVATEKPKKITIEEHFKNATALSTSLENVAAIANRYGFVHHFSKKTLWIENSNWTEHSYFQNVKVSSKGKESGKGDVISVKVNQDNNILEVIFGIGKAKLDWENMSKAAQAGDAEANNNFYVKGIWEVAQSPSESSVELINLLFGKDSAVFLSKLEKISSASQPELIKMYTRKKKFKNFGVWQTSFTAGGKKVELIYSTGVFVANVKTEETAKLVEYYFDNKDRFEK